jgi:wyosine [tRNA(Phe)-imidazoG37] synthetase (radical SAM superfamily)
MSTKRAQKHKELVKSEKEFHHRPGIRSHNRRDRSRAILDAEGADALYEWHKREKMNPELAKELNDLFDF